MRAPFLAAALVSALAMAPAQAFAGGPELLVDASTGHVILASHADGPWHPASLAKIMTVHLALKAVEAGRLSMDSPVRFSAHAASRPPSKLGIGAGGEIPLRDVPPPYDAPARVQTTAPAPRALPRARPAPA